MVDKEISENDLEILDNIKNGIDEYYEYNEIFKENNLPKRNIVPLILLPKKLKNRIINNINEPFFQNIIRNNYYSLYNDIENNRDKITKKDREEFLRIININNELFENISLKDDIKKDKFHINSIEELKNIDKIKSAKLDDLMSEKYTCYDVKREFCNRFLNIDPIILENCIYNPKNKKTLEEYEDFRLIKEIVKTENKRKMIDIYSCYLNCSQNIKLPDSLITYAYISYNREDKKNNNDKQDKKYTLYFCRECLLDSIKNKKKREAQLELPIGKIRNYNEIVYENPYNDENKLLKNITYPKIDLKESDIDKSWIKKEYLTIEAINSNVDIDNPVFFDKEIPKSINYNCLYNSYMYKNKYDIEQNN